MKASGVENSLDPRWEGLGETVEENLKGFLEFAKHHVAPLMMLLFARNDGVD